MSQTVFPEVAYPLAFSDNGDPAAVPDDAQFFRMKVYRGASSRPEIVRTKAGIPHLIPLTTTPDEFRRMVGPGRYRLEPVYSTGATIENAEAAIVVIEESNEGNRQKASASEQLIDRMFEEHRKLVDRMFEHSEKQTTETARLLATYADRHEKMTLGLAEQSQKLLSSMATEFGGYLKSSAKLLRASHPAINSKTLTPMGVLEEAEAVRNAVDDLAGSSNDDSSDRMLSLVEKTIEGGMPIVRQLIHRWMLGLSEAQAQALTGEAPVPTPTPTAADDNAKNPEGEDLSAAAIDFVGHLNEIQKHLSTDEITASRMHIATMEPAEIEAWKARIMEVTPKEAAAILKAELSKER